LIEVLIVLVIVMVLIALALPSLAGAREVTRSTMCATKLSQVSMLLRQYTANNHDLFPRIQDPGYGTVIPSFDPGVTLNKTWVDLMVQQEFINASLDSSGVPSILLCPSARDYDNDPTWAGHMPQFGVNFNLSPPQQSATATSPRSFLSKPFDFNGDQSKKIMMAESKHLTNKRGWFAVGNFNWIATRHNSERGANVVYLDGHVFLETVSSGVPASDPTHPFASANFWRNTAP